MAQNIRHRKQGSQLQNAKKENYCLVLSVIAAALIPLLVQIVTGSSGLAGYDWFSKNDNEIDFFLVCKMYAIIALATVMLVVLAVRLYGYSRQFLERLGQNRTVFIALAAYAFLALLSSFTAINMTDAFSGGYAQHEPVTVLIGYFIMLLFTYIYVRQEHNIKYFIRLFILGAAVISFLGVLQWAAVDFFAADAGKSLISMLSSIKASQITLSFEVGRVYMTLYNPNYVGSYVALVLPVMATGIFIMDRVWEKAVCAVVTLMLIICLIGSGSTTGMTAILAALLLFMVLCIPMLRKYRKVLLLTAGTALVIIVVVACINRDRIADAVNKYSLTLDDFAVDAVVLHDDCVEVDYKAEKLFAACEYSGGSTLLSLYDADRKPLQTANDPATGNIVVADNEFYNELSFGGVSFEDGTYGFRIMCRGKEYTFTNDNDEGKYCFYNIYGKKTANVVKADSIGFEGHEQFASNRGFIWSRSIPLLKKNLFSGCGPDNFIYEFPNNDYVSLLNNSYAGEVVTRPHNMYLQIGIQTGVLSLIAFLVIYGAYFVQSIRLFWKASRITTAYITGMSICVGSFAYMVCGMANDSNVCTAPVFWTLLGLGLACNHMLGNQQNK